MKAQIVFFAVLLATAVSQANDLSALEAFDLADYNSGYREVPQAKAEELLHRYNDKFRAALSDDGNSIRYGIDSHGEITQPYTVVLGLDVVNRSLGRVEYPVPPTPEENPVLHNPRGIASAPAYRYMNSNGVIAIAECVNSQGYGAWDKSLPMNANQSTCRGLLRLFIKL